MRILKISFQNNPNVGLFGFATDSYCLLPKNLKDSLVKEIKEALNVPVYAINVYNTHLIGLFCVGNESTILVPSVLWDHEIKELKKIKDVNLVVLDTRHTALGNNIAIYKDKCLVSPNLEKSIIEKLKELGFKVKVLEIAENSTIGACIAITNKGFLLHRDAENLEEIEKFLGLKGDIGTVNLGNPYVRTGIIANSHGYIIGKSTTGPELQRIDESLKFI